MSAIAIAHDAWVLVGDGEKALLLRNQGDELYPNLVVMEILANDNPLNREQGAERPGRVHESTTSRRSAMENSDWHRIGKERFAHEIADGLYKAAHAGEFAKLVVVAPPQVLHALREAFHPEVKQRIVAELHKDLTKHPVHEIEKLLTGKG